MEEHDVAGSFDHLDEALDRPSVRHMAVADRNRDIPHSESPQRPSIDLVRVVSSTGSQVDDDPDTRRGKLTVLPGIRLAPGPHAVVDSTEVLDVHRYGTVRPPILQA